MIIDRSDNLNLRRLLIKAHSRDNVGIAVANGGIAQGTHLENELVAQESIPRGHKIALVDLVAGAPINRYGHIIGYAKSNIQAGNWINNHNMTAPKSCSLDELPTEYQGPQHLESITGYTFAGFKNHDGSVGTRNILGISTSVQCVAGMAKHVVQKIKKELLAKYPNVDDVVALEHAYGCGVAIDAPGAEVPQRTLQNLTHHPNLGGEILIIGLGCEKLRPEQLISSENSGSSTIIYLQDQRLRGFEQMVTEIMREAEAKLQRLNARRRQESPVADLVVGMQCGGSDAFSGITANPVVGFASDLIVRAGGSVMFSEVTEVRDAAHLLLPRAKNPLVAQKLVDQLAWYDDYLARGGADVRANPSPGNHSGGLSNVVEKALGSIAKSGTSPIVDVIGPGERIRNKGLTFAATPASDFVCGTLQLAAGMNLHVFTTGRGSPYGLTMAPVIKVASNSSLGLRWFDLIDLDAGRIISDGTTIEDMGWELFHLILDVASGRKEVACDRLGLHNDLVLFNPGVLT